MTPIHEGLDWKEFPTPYIGGNTGIFGLDDGAGDEDYSGEGVIIDDDGNIISGGGNDANGSDSDSSGGGIIDDGGSGIAPFFAPLSPFLGRQILNFSLFRR